MSLIGGRVPGRRKTRHRSSNTTNEADIGRDSPTTMPHPLAHRLAHESSAFPNEKEPDGDTVGVKDFPVPLLLLASEWLFVRDLLELGSVDRSFGEISRESSLWHGVACHLWKSALVDWCGPEVDMSHAHLHKDDPGERGCAAGLARYFAKIKLQGI